VDPARAAALRDLTDMQTTPVSEAALSRAKAEVLRQLPMGRASVGAIAGLYLRLVDLGLPMDAEQIAARRYRGVTAEQIRAAFAKWVRPEDLAVVVKGP
jgi:zinc protease